MAEKQIQFKQASNEQNTHAMHLMNNQIIENIYAKSLSLQNNPFKHLANRIAFNGYFYHFLFSTFIILGILTAMFGSKQISQLMIILPFILIAGVINFISFRHHIFNKLYSRLFNVKSSDFRSNNLQNAIIAIEAILNSSYFAKGDNLENLYKMEEIYQISKNKELSTNKSNEFASNYNFIIAKLQDKLTNHNSQSLQSSDSDELKNEKIQKIYQNFIKTLD